MASPRQHDPDRRLRPLTVLTVLTLLASVLGAGLFAARGTADGCSFPTAIAHRGGHLDSGHTENTLTAYKDAAKSGVLGWETDIRYSLGGGAYLMHDATIDRTTNGTGAASSVAIDSTTVRVDDGQALKDQKLSKLLSLAKSYGATLAIEPKVRPTAEQARYTVGLLDHYGMRGRVVFNSFDPANLAPLRAVAPDLTYALVTSKPVTPAEAIAVGPVLFISYLVLTPELVDQYHAAGLTVSAWTADGPYSWSVVRSVGADHVVSNRPVAYRGHRDYLCTNVRWF